MRGPNKFRWKWWRESGDTKIDLDASWPWPLPNLIHVVHFQCETAPATQILFKSLHDFPGSLIQKVDLWPLTLAKTNLSGPRLVLHPCTKTDRKEPRDCLDTWKWPLTPWPSKLYKCMTGPWRNRGRNRLTVGIPMTTIKQWVGYIKIIGHTWLIID